MSKETVISLALYLSREETSKYFLCYFQVGVGCSSPLRTAGYPMSSSVKDRSIEESKAAAAAAAAIQPTLPPATVYGIRVLPGNILNIFSPYLKGVSLTE